MSGSPKNLQRDALFINPEIAALVPGTATAWNDESTVMTITADPTVYDSYAYARGSRVGMGLTGENIRAFGVYMQPPGTELSPYRVKAYANTGLRYSSGGTMTYHLIVGYGPATITGSDDDIAVYQSIAFAEYEFDELLMIEPQATPNGRALFFGIGITGVASSTPSFSTAISVQRLATAPPQFSQAVS